jgi:cobalt transporter subunit CbtB
VSKYPVAIAASRPETASRIGDMTTVASVVLAILVGALLLYGAAFAPISAVHAAAHDARHAFAFPCH